MTTLALMIAALLNLQGLDYRNAGGACKQLNNIIEQNTKPEDHPTQTAWGLCFQDETCSEAYDRIEGLEAVCGWD